MQTTLHTHIFPAEATHVASMESRRQSFDRKRPNGSFTALSGSRVR